MFYKESNAPRWMIFGADMLVCLLALGLSYLLRFNFSIPGPDITLMNYGVPAYIVIRVITFLILKPYRGIVRYAGVLDAMRIVKTIAIGNIILCILNLVKFFVFGNGYFIPFSILIIDSIACISFLVGYRAVGKLLYMEMTNPINQRASVIIFGAGELGVITKRALDRDAGTKYKVIAFTDDDERKDGNEIEGVRIYQSSKLEHLLSVNDIAHFIIAAQHITPSRRADLAEKCLQRNIRILHVPAVSNWINGELSFKQIKKINIEDLLEREPIKLNENNISCELNGKVLLITGAAGSIGSEIVRQVSRFSPKKIILIDQAESPMYELELELREKYNLSLYEIIIGDIRNRERMEAIFQTWKPELVFHAAAYKHVPLMEEHPSEAVCTNVLGTKNCVALSIENNVRKFVLISTDKAVNPTNVMGASKRMAEIYVQSLGTTGNTKFITTRFGNVLGSNGSVVQLFRKQIEKGGPLTITHPEVTRFFMTIPEACQLVLEAAALGKGGEIFIFDMGKSIKILDLAKNMIKLSRLQLGRDIHIKFTGLRPGEKLYEELLNDQENTLPTHHPQIMIAKVRNYEMRTVEKAIKQIAALSGSHQDESVVSALKDLIPEYISQNSIYCKLDNVKDGKSRLIGAEMMF